MTWTATRRNDRRGYSRFKEQSIIRNPVVFEIANKGGPMMSEHTRKPRGRRIRCLGGYRAYVSEPLPPPIAWSAELVVALSAADRSVGRLAGEGRRLPNAHLLIRPFVRK